MPVSVEGCIGAAGTALSGRPVPVPVRLLSGSTWNAGQVAGAQSVEVLQGAAQAVRGEASGDVG